MKVPKFIIFNDAHLQKSNEKEVLLSVMHMVNYAVKIGVKTIVFAGDLFESRKQQEESLFNTCTAIFDYIRNAGIHLIFFAGNHDKTSYNSYSSFLDVYKYHPQTTFTDRVLRMDIEGIDVTLIPFFDDSLLVPMLEEAEGGDMLISHFEMKGSNHLGKVSEKGNITRTTLKKWKKTYLGHYHNTHEITPDIVHLPSLRQNDFGENNLKGFSVIYDDLSYEIIKGVFKEFVKIELDVDNVDTETVKALIREHENSPNTVRFEITGSEAKLKSLDNKLFDNTGIDFKKKFDKEFSFDETERELPKATPTFDRGNIELEFEAYCERKGYDHKKGHELLTKFLNRKK